MGWMEKVGFRTVVFICCLEVCGVLSRRGVLRLAFALLSRSSCSEYDDHEAVADRTVDCHHAHGRSSIVRRLYG